MIKTFHLVLPLVAGKVTAPSCISLCKTLPPPASITGLQKPCCASHTLPPHSPQAAEAFEVKNCPRTQHFDLKWVALLQEYLILMRYTIYMPFGGWFLRNRGNNLGWDLGERLSLPLRRAAVWVSCANWCRPWGWERSPGEDGSEGKIFEKWLEVIRPWLGGLSSGHFLDPSW